MPSKKIVCEFCQTPSNKQRVAGHIKSKHAKEVGKMLFQEWRQGENITPIKQYLEARPTQNIPIASRLYEGAVYWFGPDPMFFDEDESYALYIKSQDNLDGHRAFLEECLGQISLMDFIECERQYQLKSPERLEDMKRIRQLESELKHLHDSFSEYQIHSEKQLRIYVDTFEAEEKGTLKDLQSELCLARSHCRTMERSLESLRRQYDSLEKEHYMTQQSHAESRLKNESDMEKYYLKREEGILRKLEQEKMKTVSVKKETKSEEQKKQEKKRAKKALKKAKALAKLAELSDSSDSDSDSDSD